MKAQFRIDSWLYRNSHPDQTKRYFESSLGRIRFETYGESSNPCILLAPDGPSTVEHYDELVNLLSKDLYVIVFDLPGFGLSTPSPAYDHSFSAGARVIHELLTHLSVQKAILQFTCVNGFYALRFAKTHPDKVIGLILGQTPALSEMLTWTERQIPKIIRIKVIGQIVNYFSRYKLAQAWFKIALPKGADTAPWQKKTFSVLNSGGCNCLASLVQGVEIQKDKNLESVEAPLVLLWGKADRSHRPTNPHSISEHAQNVRVIEMNSIGHFPSLESPQTVVEIAKQMITSTPQ